MALFVIMVLVVIFTTQRSETMVVQVTALFFVREWYCN